MKNSNSCAFPVDARKHIIGGLTKREYFAAMAMQGLLSAMSGLDNSQFVPNLDNTKYCADLAVDAADELLRALEKTDQQ